jgi:hypothetical protein
VLLWGRERQSPAAESGTAADGASTEDELSPIQDGRLLA